MAINSPADTLSQSKSNGHEESMTYLEGSVVFSVEGILYKIPKALLQHNSDAFAGVFESSKDVEDKPIVIHDAVHDFQEFYTVLFSPFKSCLYTPCKTPSDLRNVLGVLSITHKYCAIDLEALALSIVEHVTQPHTIRSFTDATLSAEQIFEAGWVVHSSKIMESAQSVILADLRSLTIDPFNILFLGERLGFALFVGAGYYEIMCQGKEKWGKEPRLTSIHRDNLARGMLKCYEEWDSVTKAWAVGRRIPHKLPVHTYCQCSSSSFDGVWQKLFTSQIPAYDILRQLRFAETLINGFLSHCKPEILKSLQDSRAEVEVQLAEWFTRT